MKKNNKNKMSALYIYLFVLTITIFNLNASANTVVDTNDFQNQSPLILKDPLIELYREKKYSGAYDEEELKIRTDLETSEALKRKKNKEQTEDF